MSKAELLIKEINTLPESRVAEVLDFVEFLKQKEAENHADRGVSEYPIESGEGCPICEAHRDPVTGEERFNAETIAAFEEGDAMLRGELPAKWYKSVDEMLADLELPR